MLVARNYKQQEHDWKREENITLNMKKQMEKENMGRQDN